MGFSNKTEDRPQYVTIVHNTFTVRAKEGDDGAVERTNKEGKVVWEKHYKSLQNVIIRDIRPSRFEHKGVTLLSWEIILEESLNKYILKLGYSSREAKSLLKRLANIDLDSEVTLATGTYPDKKVPGKTQPYLSVFQHGSKVMEAYEKGEIPDMELITVDGVGKWDSSKQMAFLAERVKEIFPTAKVDVDIVDDVEELPTDDNQLPF